MKKVLFVILGLVVLGGVGVILVFQATGGLTETADGFFAAVKNKDMAAARGYLSEAFKASTDDAALQQFLESGALLDVTDATWSSREISGSEGTLNGEVKTAAGGVVPLTIQFVNEKDQWKIFSIERDAPGVQTASNPEPAVAPGGEEQTLLVKQAMHDFALSVNAKDMAHFRSTVSQLWQEQFTPAKFNESYGSLFNAGIDFLVVDDLNPILEPSTPLDADGVLTVAGHFPTKPNLVHFEQKYIKEGAAWKLVGFNVNVK